MKVSSDISVVSNPRVRDFVCLCVLYLMRLLQCDTEPEMLSVENVCEPFCSAVDCFFHGQV